MSLRDFFWKGESDGKETPEAIVPKTPTTASTIPTSTSSAVPKPTHQAISPELMDYFEKVFTERNLPGPDFYEYFQALVDMESFAMSESDRYKAAFVSFKSQGITKKVLVETGGVYLQEIGKKYDDFKKLIAAKTQETEQAVGVAKNNIKSIESQIEALGKQLEEARKKLSEAEAANDYPQRLAAFEHAMSVFSGNIQGKINKIEQYITN